jgi:hypothetical protein
VFKIKETSTNFANKQALANERSEVYAVSESFTRAIRINTYPVHEKYLICLSYSYK